MDLYEVRPRRCDLADLYWAMRQSYSDDQETGEIRGLLLAKLPRISDSTTVPFLEELYPSLPSNWRVRQSAVRALAKINTEASLRTLCDILIRWRPEVYGVLFDVIRRPKNAHVLFPRLLALLPKKLYRNEVYNVAAAALKARVVKPEELRGAQGRLMRDFRAALREHAKAESNSTARIVAVHSVSSILAVMEAFPDMSGIRKAVQDAVSYEEPLIAYAAYRACRRMDWGTPPDAIDRFATEPTTRLDLFEDLRTMGRKSEFPEGWRTQQSFAEGDLARVLWGDHMLPERFKLIETRIVKVSGTMGRFYVFAFSVPFFRRGRLIGLSGPQPLDESKIVTTGAETFTLNCTRGEESIDSHFRQLRSSLRKKIARSRHR